MRNPGEVPSGQPRGVAACRAEATRRGFTLLAGSTWGESLVAFERDDGLSSVSKTHPWLTSSSPTLLVGNGREVWPRFRGAVFAGPLDTADVARDRVFDRWIEAEVRAIAAAAGRRHVLFFAHDATVDFVRLAVATGLAANARCRLAIHPSRGLWFALRGLIVLDEDVASEPATSFAPEPRAGSPCRGCPGPCEGPLASAMTQLGEGADLGAIADAWLAVRESCPIGREHRYGDEQLAYHLGRSRAAWLIHGRGLSR